MSCELFFLSTIKHAGQMLRHCQRGCVRHDRVLWYYHLRYICAINTQLPRKQMITATRLPVANRQRCKTHLLLDAAQEPHACPLYTASAGSSTAYPWVEMA